jgi:hypothetical protein
MESSSGLTSGPIKAELLSGMLCVSDPIPTRLLKANVDVLAPFLCRIFNLSLRQETVPLSFELAFVTPMLKTANLDAADPKSYQPISVISVLSKLLERLVSQQLVLYMRENKLLPKFQ